MYLVIWSYGQVVGPKQAGRYVEHIGLEPQGQGKPLCGHGYTCCLLAANANILYRFKQLLEKLYLLAYVFAGGIAGVEFSPLKLLSIDNSPL